MKLFSAVLAVCLAATAGAQSTTLIVAPPGGVLLTYTNPGANFFDLDVTNPAGITLQALQLQLNSPGGTEGTIEVWMTPNTHIGNENAQANWIKISEGSITAGVNSLTCQEAFVVNVPDTFLPQGTYGIAMVYIGVNHIFNAVTTYPAGPFADPNISVDNGTTQSVAWAAAPLNTFTFGGVAYAGTVPTFELTYTVGNVPHACAVCGTIGEGSNINSASAYELFPSAAATSAAMQGNVLSFIPNGASGYIMTDGTGSAAFIPPTGNETNLPLVDDQEVEVTLLVPIQYADNAGSQLALFAYINSNGYVSLDTVSSGQSGLLNSPTDPQGEMQADLTAFFAHHDYDNSEIGSGNISYEEDFVNNKFLVTWDGVESVPAGPNPSTVQFQFDYTTGQVDIVFEIIDGVGGSTFSGGDNSLIGWSPGGPSPRTDEFDFSTLLATPMSLNLPEILPLTLSAVGTPLIGQSFDLLTSNAPNPGIGINLLSTAQLPLPLDLAAFGAPAGTLTYIDPATAILNTISNIPGIGTLSLTLPVSNVPALAGLEILSQSFWVDLNTANVPFTNLVASNAVSCVIGNF